MGWGTSQYEGMLNIVFLSEISPKKNLIGAIKCLKNLNADVYFTIYGPQEDIGYWEGCQKELAKLPSNVRWFYEGDCAFRIGAGEATTIRYFPVSNQG